MFSSPRTSPSSVSTALSRLPILLPGQLICAGEVRGLFLSVCVFHGTAFFFTPIDKQ